MRQVKAARRFRFAIGISAGSNPFALASLSLVAQSAKTRRTCWARCEWSTSRKGHLRKGDTWGNSRGQTNEELAWERLLSCFKNTLGSFWFCSQLFTCQRKISDHLAASNKPSSLVGVPGTRPLWLLVVNCSICSVHVVSFFKTVHVFHVLAKTWMVDCRDRFCLCVL